MLGSKNMYGGKQGRKERTTGVLAGACGGLLRQCVMLVSCAYLWTGWGNVAFFIPSWAVVKAPGQGRPGAWPAPVPGGKLPEAFILRNCGSCLPRVRLG